jgi:hypothetical protein
MRAIEAKMHEIRQRFVQGVLKGMEPQQLRAFVTGIEADTDEQRRAAA